MSSASAVSSATFSEDRRYRYTLRRYWGPELGERLGSDPTARTMVFVLLNPSTADEGTDDATVRRCIGFAKRHHGWGLEIVNLFALRATNPRHLKYDPDPVGNPRNNEAIAKAAREGFRTVAAWGNEGRLQGRGNEVRRMLWDILGPRLLCMGRTAQGEPRHPLYLRKDVEFHECY